MNDTGLLTSCSLFIQVIHPNATSCASPVFVVDDANETLYLSFCPIRLKASFVGFTCSHVHRRRSAGIHKVYRAWDADIRELLYIELHDSAGPSAEDDGERRVIEVAGVRKAPGAVGVGALRDGLDVAGGVIQGAQEGDVVVGFDVIYEAG